MSYHQFPHVSSCFDGHFGMKKLQSRQRPQLQNAEQAAGTTNFCGVLWIEMKNFATKATLVVSFLAFLSIFVQSLPSMIQNWTKIQLGHGATSRSDWAKGRAGVLRQHGLPCLRLSRPKHILGFAALFPGLDLKFFCQEPKAKSKAKAKACRIFGSSWGSKPRHVATCRHALTRALTVR